MTPSTTPPLLRRRRSAAADIGFAAGAAAADELAARRRRAATVLVYSRLRKAWEAWARAAGKPVFPAASADVAAWLASMLCSLNDQGSIVRDSDGIPARGRWAPASAALAAAAIDAQHRDAELPRPGRLAPVRNVLAAAWDVWGAGGPRTDALDSDGLTQVLLLGVGDDDRDDAENRLAVLFSAAQLADGAALARLTLAEVWEAVAGATEDAAEDWTRWAERAAAAASTLVLCGVGPDDPVLGPGRFGAPTMTPFGAAKRAQRLRAAGGLPPDVPVGPQLGVSAEDQLPPSPALLRDRALLAVGFACAMRPSELAWLRWEDLDWSLHSTWGHPVYGGDGEGGDGAVDALTGRLRRSKSSAARSGKHIAVEPGNPGTGPLRLLMIWRAEATRLLGYDPVTTAPGLPVFFRLDRAAKLRTAGARELSPGAVGEAVVRRCLGARLEGSWGGGSLRSGLVTSLAATDATVREIKAVSGHQSTGVLLRYARAGRSGYGVVARTGL